MLFDLPGNIKAVEQRQPDVQKNQVRLPIQCFLDRFFAVCCLRVLFNITARLKNSGDTSPDDFVIVRNQNSHQVPSDARSQCTGTLVMGARRAWKYSYRRFFEATKGVGNRRDFDQIDWVSTSLRCV